MTRNGALAGIVVGALTVILWKNYVDMGLYEIIPGFLFASIAIFVVSKLGSPSNSMVSRFETADAAYHADK